MPTTTPAIPVTPFGPLGYITYKRTYARRIGDRTEEFPETIERDIRAFRDQLHIDFSPEDEAKIRRYMLELKCSVAGRFHWQLGTETVDRLGLMSLQNCAGTLVDDPVRPFIWTFDCLMLGSGVGFNIQREHVYQIPKVKGVKTPIQRWDVKDADFIVPDSREGWVTLLEKTLQAYFHTGKGFTYSTMLVRGKGAPIAGFGGSASGPEELCEGIGHICAVLENRVGKKLRPIDCLDIMNIIGAIVVAGNVRRSAQLAIGDPDDLQYLNAKRWDLGNIPNWRAMSNNSIACNDIKNLPNQFWDGYSGNGEPYGLVNLKLSRSCGRLGETQYKDNCVVYNPCAEQGLNDRETCSLAEIFLPNIESKQELWDVTRLLYTINKHSLQLKCHQEDTEEIVHKNLRMGLSVTGILQAGEERIGWLSPTYERLRKYDDEYSEKRGWRKSIKLTTVKPAGTLSLLPGVTPGIHPGFSQYFIRRIQIASDSPLVEICRKSNIPIEPRRQFDGTADHTTVVAAFPCRYPDGTILAKDLTAIEQLEWVKRLQTEWSDNAVSCTIYYRREELGAIKDWLAEHYNKSVKTVSFLLHNEHGFEQAPYEEITKEEYEARMKTTKPIEPIQAVITEDDGSTECQSGMCPVK